MTLQNHHWIATDLMLPPVSNEDAYAEYVEAQDKSFANGPCDALLDNITINFSCLLPRGFLVYSHYFQVVSQHHVPEGYVLLL